MILPEIRIPRDAVTDGRVYLSVSHYRILDGTENRHARFILRAKGVQARDVLGVHKGTPIMPELTFKAPSGGPKQTLLKKLAAEIGVNNLDDDGIYILPASYSLRP
jgi:hypothetical protein